MLHISKSLCSLDSCFSHERRCRLENQHKNCPRDWAAGPSQRRAKQGQNQPQVGGSRRIHRFTQGQFR
ncbi:hypothetical protein BS17DRAFT_555788 [Gyrodon lividus]|nr:hypothetical protein BS17DRAFT_555788 [Gyrodon lividus]